MEFRALPGKCNRPAHRSALFHSAPPALPLLHCSVTLLPHGSVPRCSTAPLRRCSVAPILPHSGGKSSASNLVRLVCIGYRHRIDAPHFGQIVVERCHLFELEYQCAGMVELADTLALGASAARHAGSSPVPGTIS